MIEDTERRRKGEFYTPTIWANEAHKMISDQFGDDWKDEYAVWDCAWGTGNLTRDYKFKELYCSTINEGDLEIGKRYNPNSVKFQYDFLNDDVDYFENLKAIKDIKGYLEVSDFNGSKLYKEAPQLIKSLLDGKKFLFFINPPYGTANDLKTIRTDVSGRRGMAQTAVNLLMKKNKIGACSQNLYAQFIYRILLLKEYFVGINMAIFCKGSILTASTYSKLRELLVGSMCYKNGMIFQASQFADVSGAWGIYFTLWGSNVVDRNSLFFNTEIKILDEGNNIYKLYDKIAYSVTKDVSCSNWCKPITDVKPVDFVQMTSAIKYVEGVKNSSCIGKLIPNALGYYFNISNTVEKNNMEVFLVSSCTKSGHGVSVLDSNFLKVCSNFTARRLITGQYANWINDKDEYMIPNTNNEHYKQWEQDCIVYSLFNTASNQSSLRKIDYNGKVWDIKNEFFFISAGDMKELANEHNNDGVYQDIKQFGEERYVYKMLQNVELSEDAQAVLDKAIELTKESFKYREMFNEDHPEYHINTWDAGWYQIKGVLKEYMPEELKEFNEIYKELGDRMRPLVYELGFLKE